MRKVLCFDIDYVICKTKNTNYQNIFISHLINEKLIDNAEDSYFGSVPQELVKKNKKVLVVYIKHTTKSSSQIKCNNKLQLINNNTNP